MNKVGSNYDTGSVHIFTGIVRSICNVDYDSPSNVPVTTWQKRDCCEVLLVFIDPWLWAFAKEMQFTHQEGNTHP